MRKSQVRCWRHEVPGVGGVADVIHISYPEGHYGHDLLSCLKCGHVYAAAVARQLYSDQSLVDKLAAQACVSCGSPLGETCRPYPDEYLSHGAIRTFARPLTIPPDEDSLVLQFDELYST